MPCWHGSGAWTSTQDVLEQLAVVPSALDRWLVDALVPDTGPSRVAALTAAEQRGLLMVSTNRISFRHELTRRAIAGSLPAARLMALNQRVLPPWWTTTGMTSPGSFITRRKQVT